MHAPRSSPEHEERLQGREAQTRSWAAPLPVAPAFNIHNGARQRLEWDTRDTINNRLWTDNMESGAKMVTSAMLATHDTNGAGALQPTSSRKDDRPYHGTVQYFPDATSPTERPVLPARSLFHNPWANGYNIESGDVMRELRGTVKESNRFLTDDVSARMTGRTFEHQWIPVDATRAIAERKIEASALLRPAQDDYRRNYLR